MDDLENLYNKRFQDKELPNDDFDVDGLWNAVEADLDSGEDKKGGYFRSYWPFGILLLLIVGASVYFYNGMEDVEAVASSEILVNENRESNLSNTENEDENQSLIADAKGESVEDLNNNSTSTSNSTATLNSHNSAKKKAQAIAKTRKSTATTNLAPNNIATSIPTKKINSSVNKNLAENSVAISAAENEKKETLNEKNAKDRQAKNEDQQNAEVALGLEDNEDSNKAKDSNTTISVKNNETPKIEETINNNTIVLSALDLASTNFTFPSLKELKEKGEVKKVPTIYPLKKKVLVWEVAATTGANKLIGTYSLPTTPISATSSEKGSYGNSYGLKVGVLWKKHWTLKTGFEYHKLWSQFNYGSSEDIDIPKDSTLAQVVFDPSTNTTVSRIYIDTFATVTNTRKVVHHNNYNLYSIPIEIGWQNDKGPFLYGLSAGLSLNFVRGQKGRRLDRESFIVTDFESDSDLTAFKDFGMGVRLTPMLGYQLTSNLSIRLTPQLEWYGLGKSEAVKEVYRLGGGLGLGWRF